MILDYWDSGFRNYSTNLHEINGPEDMKGMLIRIPDNPIQAATAAALGSLHLHAELQRALPRLLQQDR